MLIEEYSTATDYEKVNSLKVRIQNPENGFKKNIIIRKYKLPNGIIDVFYVDDDKNSVQILPMTEDGHFYIVKQWRPGPEAEQLELCGGGMEDNEEPEQAAIRELKEETGLVAGNMIYMGAVNYSPFSNGKRHMFIATSCIATGMQDLDANEFLKVLKIDQYDLRKLVKDGKIRGADLIYMGLDHLGLLTK